MSVLFMTVCLSIKSEEMSGRQERTSSQIITQVYFPLTFNSIFAEEATFCLSRIT